MGCWVNEISTIRGWFGVFWPLWGVNDKFNWRAGPSWNTIGNFQCVLEDSGFWAFEGGLDMTRVVLNPKFLKMGGGYIDPDHPMGHHK